MRSETEILQAIQAMMEARQKEQPGSVTDLLCKVTIDTLNWTIGRASAMGKNLDSLRAIQAKKPVPGAWS